MKFIKINGVICFLILWILILWWFYKTSTKESEIYVDTGDSLDPINYSYPQNDIFNGAYECIEAGLFEATIQGQHGKFHKVYSQIHEMANKCSKDAKDSLPLIKIKNQDEYKFFLPHLNESDACNIVTLGIGRDIDAELELKRKYVNCKFLGADPDDEVSGNMYHNYLGGTFVKTAIARDDGVYNASIIDKNSTKYHEEVMYHMSFKKFIDIYNGNIPINMLFIDVEGAEFEILEYFVDNIDEFPDICQINVELHFPDQYPPMGKNILDNLYKMTAKKQFLLIHVEPCGPFYRIYMINTNSKTCIKSYFLNQTDN